MKKYMVFGVLFTGVWTVFLWAMVHTACASTSLNDYWNGNADWKFVRTWRQNDLGGNTDIAGTHIEVVDGNRDLFTRKKFPGNSRMGTEVRRSTDQISNV